MRLLTGAWWGLRRLHFQGARAGYPTPEPPYDAMDNTFLGKVFLLRFLWRSLTAKKWRKPIVDANLIVCYGPTANNQKQFDWFAEHMVQHGVNVNFRENLARTSGVEVRKNLNEAINSLLLFVSILIWVWGRETNAWLSRAVCRFAKECSRWLFWGVSEGLDLPRVAVVANDHTALSTAFTAAMKTLGTRTVYLQHAEIPTDVAPLDFDLSLLWNFSSLEKYREAGEPKGLSLVAPRASRQNRIRLAPGEKQKVVLYTGGDLDSEFLDLAFSALLSNLNTSRVAWKPHPNPSYGDYEPPLGVATLNELPNYAHLAISVPSSVVIELLDSGVPVFQLNSPNARHDHYGHAGAHLVPQIELSDLSSTFWAGNFFNKQWRERFSYYQLGGEPPDGALVIASRVVRGWLKS